MYTLLYITLFTIINTALTSNVTWTLPTTNCTGPAYSLTTHTGGCVLKVAYGPTPTNFREIASAPTTLSASSCITPAYKYLQTNGLLLAGNIVAGNNAAQDINDTKFKWIAKAFQEMTEYNASSACDGYNQCLLMQKLYEYRANIPIVDPTPTSTVSGSLFNDWSSCDIIMTSTTDSSTQTSSQTQINEVIEHLLHAISSNGLANSMPATFGFTNSTLSAAMDEAIASGQYNTASYESFSPEQLKQRIKVQEYFYCVFGACSGFFATYGNPQYASEFPLTPLTCDQLKVKNPKGYYLYEEVIKKIVKLPSTATLTSIGKLGSGNTPDAAPTLTSGSVSNDLCKCTCTTGCCYNTPLGTTATYGSKPAGLVNTTSTLYTGCKNALMQKIA